ncbi:MAG: glycine/betaine ABC transporter substrate-binding protein [Pseudonocardiales bacterium]|nr:MAG: glycine/betaine ABC transporter substrate-binding protein [Pseudonocardiales bacterium]
MRVANGARRVVVIAAVSAVAVSLASCSSSKKSSSGGGNGVLKGASFTVGSKEFTEQKILCEITAQALEKAGATVKRQCGLSGSATVRSALTSGRIDMYWEYTGTGWITHLKHTTPIHDSQGQYDAVAKEDLEKNKIKWLPAAPFDNTYALGVKKDNLPDVKTVSDYAALVNSDKSKGSLCVATEFVSRDDGLPGLEKAYGFKGEKTSTLDEGAIYNSIKKTDPCNFGEVFTTDGRIEGLGLRVLADDKKFFPVYNPALNIRDSVFQKYPKLADVFAPISKALDTKTMQGLNSDVDNQGDSPAQVATQFLKDHG